MSAKRLAVNSMLSAACAVLGYVSIDMGNIKITFESLPILLSALLLGPVDALAVGGVGTAIYQFFRYGVTITTPLWMLPYMFCGLLAGAYAKKKQFRLTSWQTMGVVAVCELLVTILNTGVIYTDSRIFGYYSAAYVFGSLATRLVICAARAAAFGILLPIVIDSLSKSKILARQEGVVQ